MTKRTLHLNLNLGASGHPTAFIDGDYFANVARIAEDGLFDSVFLANISGLRAEGPGQGLDPIVTLTIMAAATSRIGLIGTISATLHHPYSIARWFASLEHVSNGRVGWNVVTTRNKNEGLNYGFDPLPDRETRYARAAESIEIVNALWDSWQEGAIVDEPGSAPHFDRERMKPINYAGKHFSVAGPLQLPSYRRTRPLITQAGGSDEGIEVAAKYADAVFTSQLYIEPAQEYYRHLRAAAARCGRDPDSISVLPGLNPVIASTDEEARRRAARDNQRPADPAEQLRSFARWASVDPAALELDEPFPLELLPPSDPVFGSVGFDRSVRLYLERNQHRTVREILADGSRGGRGGGHRAIVGTPAQIADDLEEWFVSRAADGFIMGFGSLPRDLELFIEHVVPLLQKKGIFRHEYEEITIRERYRAA
jgi:FMN-dependent oxidoreductase (nitrilotriacetate monooxygenase family)